MPSTTVRILVACDVDGQRYRPNDLVAIDAAAAKTLAKEGKADGSKDAVAYLTRQGVQPIAHPQPAAPAPSNEEKPANAQDPAAGAAGDTPPPAQP